MSAAERYDVGARLTEGETALEHAETYVRACHLLGYQHPDLTARESQLRDLYGTEAGLDLQVLGADAAELRAAVSAVEEALWVQRGQVTELATAWRGSGAQAATQFLRRHCDTADQVAADLRVAAEQCATLGDELWRAVDGKVAITVAIDERAAAQRPGWLAAAQAVTAASGDRSAAEGVVNQQVMPFVDNDIRNDWLVSISAANASIAASYDSAIHAISSASDVHFDIPGDLGPRWRPDIEERSAVPALPMSASPLPGGPVPTVPAAATAPAPMPAQADQPAPEEPDGAAASPLDDLAGLSSGAGGLGGLGGATGGGGGLLGSLVDGIGGLLGSLIGAVGGSGIDADPIGLESADDLLDDDTPDAATKPDATEEPAAAAEEAVAGEAAPDVAVVGGSSDASDPPAAEPAAQQHDQAPQPEAPPQPAEASAPAAPASEGRTPCEIAEDQLPQVGQ